MLWGLVTRLGLHARAHAVLASVPDVPPAEQPRPAKWGRKPDPAPTGMNEHQMEEAKLRRERESVHQASGHDRARAESEAAARAAYLSR